jgi:hypothetical protein
MDIPQFSSLNMLSYVHHTIWQLTHCFCGYWNKCVYQWNKGVHVLFLGCVFDMCHNVNLHRLWVTSTIPTSEDFFMSSVVYCPQTHICELVMSSVDILIQSPNPYLFAFRYIFCGTLATNAHLHILCFLWIYNILAQNSHRCALRYVFCGYSSPNPTS